MDIASLGKVVIDAMQKHQQQEDILLLEEAATLIGDQIARMHEVAEGFLAV